jgi:hypothetical protein
MSKIVLKLSEDGKRICAGHLTARGDALKPGSTDVTAQVLKLADLVARPRPVLIGSVKVTGGQS